MLPLLITVMLQETKEGERYVWRHRHRRMEKWGVIKQASSQTSLSLTLCVCVSLWPLSEGGNKIVLYCSTSLPSNNSFPRLSHPFWETLAPHPAWICSICSSRPGLVIWIRLQYCSMSPLPIAKMYHNLFFLHVAWRTTIEEGELIWRVIKKPLNWFPPALEQLISVRAYLSICKAPQCGRALCTPSSPSCTSSRYELAGWLPPRLRFEARDTSVGRRRSRKCILNNEREREKVL